MMPARATNAGRLQSRAVFLLLPDDSMSRLRSFVMLTVLGGLAVILPLVLFVALARWLIGLLANFTAPLAETLGVHLGGGTPLPLLAVVALLVALCFVTGLAVRTRIGALLHDRLDALLGRLAPGYRAVRDTVGQLLGSADREALRGEVALVAIHGPRSPARQLGIVTARHDDGTLTVYVPTAPVPTQGFVYHLPPECVRLLPEVSVTNAMRMVFACGAGAADILSGAVCGVAQGASRP